MKIDKEKLFELYMQWVYKVLDECDWKTSFEPKEIVYSIANIIENNPELLNNNNMSKERYNQIIDEVYENFEKQCIPGTGKKMSKEEFINICKINPEFSEKWGLKIEERELSAKERVDIFLKQPKEFEDKYVPTKLITLTYNNETIESYEYYIG